MQQLSFTKQVQGSFSSSRSLTVRRPYLTAVKPVHPLKALVHTSSSRAEKFRPSAAASEAQGETGNQLLTWLQIALAAAGLAAVTWRGGVLETTLQYGEKQNGEKTAELSQQGKDTRKELKADLEKLQTALKKDIESSEMQVTNQFGQLNTRLDTAFSQLNTRMDGMQRK